MKSSVIIFPGSNCDRDMHVALRKFGFKNQMVWHNDAEIPKSDLIVLPGGFSYGDYLRCGSIAGKSRIIKSVIDFANSGGLVLGICNGFQILTETGLLPGILQQNKYLNFICKNVFVKIKNKENKYFEKIKKDVLELHIAHNEGNYFCSNDELKSIEDVKILSKKFSQIIQKGDLVFLYGEIGVGKTTFVRYLINHLEEENGIKKYGYGNGITIPYRAFHIHGNKDQPWGVEVYNETKLRLIPPLFFFQMLEERELNKEHFQRYYDIEMDDTPEDPDEESKVYEQGSMQDPEMQRLTGKEILAKIKREKIK